MNIYQEIEYLECDIEEQEKIGSEFFGGEAALKQLRKELERAYELLAKYEAQ